MSSQSIDPTLKTDDFDYDLPEELIAARPPEHRGESRMMVVDRGSCTISHHRFVDLPQFFLPGDLWVINDTRVVPARFFSDDERMEVVKLDEMGPLVWKCLVRPGKRLRVGRELVIGGVRGEVIEVLPSGERLIRWDGKIEEAAHGHLALPHYLGRGEDEGDRERYQTVYARNSGAIAAPTAGLHFTPELMERLPHTAVTLHVGVGTFAPVKADRVVDHEMHSERYDVPQAAAGAIAGAKRVIAVGTTVVRVLEHVARENDGEIVASNGATEIFITPGYSFRAVNAMLTNFHLPKSTLMMLISAFAGKDLVMTAYQEAIKERYRFYSYGDCMLIL